MKDNSDGWEVRTAAGSAGSTAGNCDQAACSSAPTLLRQCSVFQGNIPAFDLLKQL